MKSKAPADASRRDVVRWSIVLAAGATALPALAQKPAGEPGAKDLFFGEDNPALVDARSVKVRRTDGATTTPTSAPGTAPPPAQKPGAGARTSPGLRVWLAAADDASGTKRLSPQQTFKTGQRVRLWMEANRTGYIYLINVGTSGATRLIFPRPGQDNGIAARKPMAMSSALVFGEPAGTEQLVAVLAAAPIEDAAVQLQDGSMMKVGLRPGASTPPRKGGGTSAESASLDLALADLKGSKDLKFEDDGAELIAVSRQSNDGSGAFAPVVVNLKLTHRP